jgi:hypothetical protein
VISLRRGLPISMGLLASGLSACATLAPPPLRAVAPAVIAEAYQQGVRDAHAQLATETEADLHATWTAPIVQEVWIPARVVGGVLIPGHREWVVIHPAAWQRSSSISARPTPTGGPANDRRRP